MPYTRFKAGQRLTASGLNNAFDFLPLKASKAADQSVSSATTGTTFVNDIHLQLAYPANSIVFGKLWLAVEGDTAADIKMRFTLSTAFTRFDWGAAGLALGATTAEGDLRSVAQMGGTTSPISEITIGSITANWSNIHIPFTFVTLTAGTLILQWAQVTASATNTIVKAGSYMEFSKQ